jgi:hypothetical protein
LGWVDDVRPLYAASDVVVHNAGGLASVEAFAAGIPVVGHACLPGHGHRNAEEMAAQGIAEYAPDDAALIESLHRLAGTPTGAALAARARAIFNDDPTLLITNLARAEQPSRSLVRPARVSWARRLAALATAVPIVLVGVSFGVSEATERGFGTTAKVPTDQSALYLGVLLDRASLGDPATAAALLAARVSAVVPADLIQSDPTDVLALEVRGVSVVAAAPSRLPRAPENALRAFSQPARALAETTGQPEGAVVCLHGLGLVSLTEARASHTQFIVARYRFNAATVPTMHGSSLAVLDLVDDRPQGVAQALVVVRRAVEAQGLHLATLPDWTGA